MGRQMPAKFPPASHLGRHDRNNYSYLTRLGASTRKSNV